MSENNEDIWRRYWGELVLFYSFVAIYVHLRERYNEFKEEIDVSVNFYSIVIQSLLHTITVFMGKMLLDPQEDKRGNINATLDWFLSQYENRLDQSEVENIRCRIKELKSKFEPIFKTTRDKYSAHLDEGVITGKLRIDQFPDLDELKALLNEIPSIVNSIMSKAEDMELGFESLTLYDIDNTLKFMRNYLAICNAQNLHDIKRALERIPGVSFIIKTGCPFSR